MKGKKKTKRGEKYRYGGQKKGNERQKKMILLKRFWEDFKLGLGMLSVNGTIYTPDYLVKSIF